VEENLSSTDGEDLREDIIAMDVEQLLREILHMFLASEAIFIFKNAQFAGAQNMLTKG
jgi:hypothetical protein